MNQHVKTKALGRWLKNNLALIIIVCCILAIVAIVLVATLSPAEPTIPVDSDPVDNPDNPTPSNPTPENPAPVVEDPVVTPQPEVFTSPLQDYTLGMTFTDDVSNMFVFNSTLRRWEAHRAVDMLAPLGTAVSPMKSGTVTAVGSSYGLGNYVEIDHGDGIVATYASLDNICVEVGAEVTSETKIGETSETANYEFLDGAHLHLSVTVNGELIDPLSLFTASDDGNDEVDDDYNLSRKIDRASLLIHG